MSESKNKSISEKLEKIAPSFCAAKWSQVLLNLQVGERHNCCLAPSQKIDAQLIQQNPQAFFNDSTLKEEREAMLKGEKISACHVCWKAEESGHLSDRHHKSAATWSSKFLEKENLKMEGVIPSYVEVSFGNKCQLMCTYCNPHNSSSLAKESKKYGPYLLSQDHNWLDKENEELFLDENENHPYATAFWNWFIQNNKNFEVLRFTGGEPLISKWIHRFLDWLKDNSMEHAEIGFNSNLAVPVELLDSFISKLKKIPTSHYKKINFYTSVDGWGKGAELARYGLKLDLFEKNFNRLMTEFPASTFRITSTLNVIAFPDTLELFKKVLEFKNKSNFKDQVAIVCYPIHYPRFLSLNWTKDFYKKNFEKILHFIEKNINEDEHQIGFYEFERDFFKKAVNFDETINPQEGIIDIFLYFSQFKMRKGIELVDLPSEIKSIVKLGEERLLQSKFEDISINTWVRAEPWISDESKRKLIREYIFSKLVSGEYNIWDALKVLLISVNQQFSYEWIPLLMTHYKTRLGAFELLYRKCIENKDKYQLDMRHYVIEHINHFDDYNAKEIIQYCRKLDLKWIREDKENILAKLEELKHPHQIELFHLIKSS